MKYRIISKYSDKIFQIKEAGTPDEDLILELRDMLDEIESRILSITGNFLTSPGTRIS